MMTRITFLIATLTIHTLSLLSICPGISAYCTGIDVANATRLPRLNQYNYAVIYSCTLPATHLSGDLRRQCLATWDYVAARYTNYHWSGETPVCGLPSFVTNAYMNHSVHGASPQTATSIKDCLDTCNRSTSCFAIDWNTQGEQCWHHSSSSCDVLLNTNKVIHYKLTDCNVRCNSNPFDNIRYSYTQPQPQSPGQTLHYRCQNGYQFKDGGTIQTRTVICQADGQYSTHSQCYRTCDPLQPGDNNIHRTSSGVIFDGTVTTYQCDTGYVLQSGSNTFVVQCLSTGLFNVTSIPSCQPIRCHIGTLGIHHSASKTELKYGESTTVACERGYQFPGGSPPMTVQCQVGGDISQTIPQCQKRECTIPTIDNSISSNVTKYFFEESITLQCLPGYQFPNGSIVVSVTCGDSDNFSPMLPNCERRPCHFHTTDDGFNISSAISQSTTYLYRDVIIEIDCLKGHYFPSGASRGNVTCSVDGSFQPKCSRKLCDLPNTRGPAVYTPGTYRYGDVINVTCQPGYQMIDGSDLVIVTCDENGNFGNVSAYCNSVSVKPGEQVGAAVAQHAGVIGGTVAAAILLLALLIVIIVIFLRRRGRNSASKQTSKAPYSTPVNSSVNEDPYVDTSMDNTYTALENNCYETNEIQGETNMGERSPDPLFPRLVSELYAVPDKRKKKRDNEESNSGHESCYELAKSPTFDETGDVVFVENDIYDAGDAGGDDDVTYDVSGTEAPDYVTYENFH